MPMRPKSSISSLLCNASALLSLRFLSSTASAFVAAFDYHQQGSAAKRLSSNMSNKMSTSETDASIYNSFVSSAVDITQANVSNNSIGGMSTLTFIRSSRDIDVNARRKFLHHVLLQGLSSEDDNGDDDVSASMMPTPIVMPPVELCPNIQARIPSPSGEKVAIFTKQSQGNGSEKEIEVVEIWTHYGTTLSRKVILDDAALHGSICKDSSWFGSFHWNADETAIVYCAEESPPTSKSFFAKSKGTDSSDSHRDVVGGGNTLGIGKGENWGEKYNKTSRLNTYILNVDTGKVGLVANVPGKDNSIESTSTNGGYTIGQPVFSPCGNYLVYTAWDAGGGGNMPKRLGSIYCYQRQCAIYSSPIERMMKSLSVISSTHDNESGEEKDGSFLCITANDRLARSPRFVTDGKGRTNSKLVFLSNIKGFDTHGGCMALHSIEWDSVNGLKLDSRRELVEVVHLAEDDDAFPGLFVNQLPQEPFVSGDGKFIYATTQWRSVIKIIRIDLITGEVQPLIFCLGETEGAKKSGNLPSQSLLCLTQAGDAIVLQSEPHSPPIIGFLSASSLASMDKNSAIASTIIASLGPIAATGSFDPTNVAQNENKMRYHVVRSQPNHGSVKTPVEGILLIPSGSNKRKKLPMIVVPHGGPHSCTSTSYYPSYSFLCESGYAVLHVNYRGSSGFGQSALESLAGNVGSQDVKDVVHLTRHVLKQYCDDIDNARVGMCGGSHGGFLTGHSIGQYPDLFKVAAMRNPVTNISTMTTATDIPDWCYVEGLGLGTYDWKKFRGPTKEELSMMWDKSPIAHMDNVKAPTLIAVGQSDKRVPPSQGIEYYHALRSKGIDAKLLLYEDDDHAIDRVQSEADHWINTKQWFDKYL